MSARREKSSELERTKNAATGASRSDRAYHGCVLSNEDLYGASSWALIKSAVDVCAPGDPFAIARGLGLEIVMGSMRHQCGALAGNDPPTILLRRRRDVRTQQFSLAHEIAHYAITRTGALDEHTEDDADEVAARLLCPRGWIRLECLTRGRAIEELPSLCPYVDPRIVLMRARHVLGLDVAVDDAA